jgi:hypothetical protein
MGSTGVPLLMSTELAARAQQPVRSVGRFRVKGVAEPMEAGCRSGAATAPLPDAASQRRAPLTSGAGVHRSATLAKLRDNH